MKIKNIVQKFFLGNNNVVEKEWKNSNKERPKPNTKVLVKQSNGNSFIAKLEIIKKGDMFEEDCLLWNDGQLYYCYYNTEWKEI